MVHSEVQTSIGTFQDEQSSVPHAYVGAAVRIFLHGACNFL